MRSLTPALKAAAAGGRLVSSWQLPDLQPFNAADVPIVFEAVGSDALKDGCDHQKVADALNSAVNHAIGRAVFVSRTPTIQDREDALEDISRKSLALLLALGYNIQDKTKPDLTDQPSAESTLTFFRNRLRNYSTPHLTNRPAVASAVIRVGGGGLDVVDPPPDQDDSSAHTNRLLTAEAISMLPQALASIVEILNHEIEGSASLKRSTKHRDDFRMTFTTRWILAFEAGVGHLPRGYDKAKNPDPFQVVAYRRTLEMASERLPNLWFDQGATELADRMRHLTSRSTTTLAEHLKEASREHLSFVDAHQASAVRSPPER